MSIQLLKNELVKEREEKYKLAKIIRDYENNQSIEKPAEKDNKPANADVNH